MSKELEHELALARDARDEWMGKWRHAESRLNAIWNDAISAARMRVGHHKPRCLDECMQCWFYDEAAFMMRGDPNNYVPIKERMRKAASDLKLKCSLGPKERKAYFRGLDEMVSCVEKMVSDRE